MNTAMKESIVTMTQDAPAFPMPRQCPFKAPPGYAEAQARPGLTRVTMWDGSTAWLASRHEDVKQILRDRRFSAVPSKPGYPFVSEAIRSLLLGEEPTFVSMDAPQHTKYRRMLAPEFTVQRIEALRPRIQHIVDDLIDEMIGKEPPTDFVEAFALAVPSLAISELLGVPYQDHDFFQKRARDRMNLSAGPEVPLIAGREIAEYLDQLLAARERDPGEGKDLLSRLVIDQVRPGNLDRRDAIAIARLILVAGHETTANVIAMGTMTLLRHPDQLEALRADPSLVPNAVEEVLRYLTVPHFNSTRVCVEDAEVGGTLIKAGEGVLAMVSAANKDPAAFPDPERFDIRRKANHHVTFADGTHQCLGQPLARLELNIVFTTLFQRMPGLRLDVAEDQLSFKHDQRAYGVYSLPVSW
jgi:cytochrome P450